MPWFKIDDSFWRSRKVRKLGRERVPAVGLWTLCGDWSADNLTDGFVPWEVVEDWDDDRSISKHLVHVGLWIETEVDGEDGVLFHDWEDWQPTSAQVKQRRKADAERRARWRETQRQREAAKSEGASHRASHSDASQCDNTRDATVHNLRDSHAHTADQDLFNGALDMSRRDTDVPSRHESRGESALPDPTRPDPSRPSLDADTNRRRKRPAHALPDTWRPNDNHVSQASRLGLDLDREARMFRNHAEANDRRQVVWDAAFRQWLDHAVTYGRTQSRGKSSAESLLDIKKRIPGGVA